MKVYQECKAAGRQKAIDWQSEAANNNYSYGELVHFSKYFTRLAKRLGLFRSFGRTGLY